MYYLPLVEIFNEYQSDILHARDHLRFPRGLYDQNLLVLKYLIEPLTMGIYIR